MSLSRKHYCAVAAIIANECERAPKQATEIFARGRIAGASNVAADIADYFASDNPQFDRARFLAACKVQS
jgi:hypothetical protein